MEIENVLSIWNGVTIRPLQESDSMEELTELLHRAYQVLADMGLRFFATYQTPEQTRERIQDAYCLIGEKGGKIVATISCYQPRSGATQWYAKEGVAHFGQFAVDPELQQNGLGGHLIALLEEHARQKGMHELALDTSEKAEHLCRYYAKRGYRFIQYHQWDSTNYRSVILSKTL